MAFLNKIFKNQKVAKTKTPVTRKNKKFVRIFLKFFFTKITPLDKKPLNKKPLNNKIRSRKRSMAAPKIYSKDDIVTAIHSKENIKARSRSHSISYDLRPAFNPILTPDEKTFRPINNINIKVNVFWGEGYEKEQVYLSIPRTSSYNSFKNDLSKKLGYKMPRDFSILYHTRRYHQNNITKRILLDYWIKNKILWFVNNDFTFRKHMLFWRDNIEITVVKKSII